MNEAWQGYSASHALRSGGVPEVRLALQGARERTLALADAFSDALGPGGMRIPYAPGLNPPLWELGHIAWFQEWWVGRNRERQRAIACAPDHTRAPSLLAQSDNWYDSSRVEHPIRWELPLPSAAATRDYLQATLEQTLELLGKLPAEVGDDALYFFRLTALPEQMHAEAGVYMARQLGVALDAGVASVNALAARPPAAGVLSVPAQQFQMGSPGPGFAFDNELGSHSVALAAFEIDAGPVTWSRFLPFVEQGGYAQAKWWSPAGWAWLRESGTAATSAPGKPGQPGHPNAAAAHVNAYEAEAWCRWAGRRLPSEAEWECAALTEPGFHWGQVWEWTSSPFLPYPGFEPHPYRDYSQPWFASRRVLRGACAATGSAIAHPRYRNFFEPHRRDIFSGFRSCA